MKLIFCLLLVFIFGALAEDNETKRANARKWAQECMKELGASQETLQKLVDKEEVDEPEMKKVAFCMFKKAGKMTEDGDLNLEQIKEDLQERFSNEETVNKIVKECAVKKDTPEETAGFLATCIRQHIRASH